MTMSHREKAALDRHLTTDPENQPGPPADEIDADQPDPCPRCEWVGLHEAECPVRPVALSAERRHALLWAWALYQVASHEGSEDSFGRSCDERGCAICNGGDEAIEWIVESIEHPDPELGSIVTGPDDRELLDMVGELAAIAWELDA